MIPVDRRALLALAGAALATRPALALDPGVATGGYRGDGGDFDVSHAVALQMDDAEGFGETGYRVLLSTTEVAPSALMGLAFPPVWGQAMAGRLKGLLVKVDPADRTSITVTILAPPEPGYSLATTTLSNTEGLWDRLDAGASRISGALKADASEHLRFDFSAPVFTNPVVADLKGPAVQASGPVKALLARAAALQRGDLAAVRAMSTESAAAHFAEPSPELMKQIRAQLPALVDKLKTAKRAVIRRETAAVMLDKGGWASAMLVDGVWKAAD